MSTLTKILIVTSLAVSGCAAQQQRMASTENATVGNHCEFTAEQVAEIRSLMLEHLIAEWPVLDAQCEGISRVVRQRPDGVCSIPGGPLKKHGCPIPSHRGYIITFDSKTLLPMDIYWVPSDS